MRIRVTLLALGLLLGSAPAATAQDAPKTPAAAFRSARDFLDTGSLELAADALKDFLNLKPSDQDYLDLETKYGANVFQGLRNVPRWLPDPKKDEDFKKTVVEGIIAGSLKANDKLLRDPKRLLRLVQNLGESREERDFAIDELNRSGDAVVPILVENLRINTATEYRTGALTAVTRLNAAVVPGLVVATENVPDELKVGLIRALAARPDVVALVGKADTNFAPYLWYLAAAPAEESAALRDAAIQTLRVLSGDRSDAQQADVELVKYARPMLERRGDFAALDKVKNRVKVWVWDDGLKTVKPVELTPAQAEEQFGLKYLKWAIDRRPGAELAQDMFLSLATERAVERASFGSLATTEPTVSQLLAAAPAPLLVGMLDSALAEKKTALAFGLTQALGDRAEKSAAIPTYREGSKDPKPAPLVKALSYPDPRVQLAAATALLRLPAVEHGANARIVEVLKRAAGTDAAADAAVGRALIVDPLIIRGDQVASLMRSLGYQTEVLGTGQALLKRVNRSSDFDLILLDRHAAQPELKDVLAQLAANANAGRRPVLLIASPEKPEPVPVEILLARLAAVIAATETTDVVVPPPYENDRRKTKTDNDDLRRANVEFRDRQLMRINDGRLARMRRLVDAANLGTSPALRTRLDLRLHQLTLAALVAEYDPTPDYAPAVYRELQNYTLLLRKQPELAKALDGASTAALVRLIEQLETAMTTPQIRETNQRVYAKLDAEELDLPRAPGIDPLLEARLKVAAAPYRNVSIIAEPYAAGSTVGNIKYGLAYDIQATIADPAQRPRDPAEKKASTKMAVEWLRRLAVGEQPGYDLVPAVPALRQALGSDDLAADAIEALSRVPVAEAQQDLLRFAATAARPVALRGKAADAAIRHVQAHGKMSTAEVNQALATALTAEANAEMKSKLAVLVAALSGTPADLLSRIKAFTVPVAAPAKPAAAPMPTDGTKPADPPADEKKS